MKNYILMEYFLTEISAVKSARQKIHRYYVDVWTEKPGWMVKRWLSKNKRWNSEYE